MSDREAELTAALRDVRIALTTPTEPPSHKPAVEWLVIERQKIATAKRIIDASLPQV